VKNLLRLAVIAPSMLRLHIIKTKRFSSLPNASCQPQELAAPDRIDWENPELT